MIQRLIARALARLATRLDRRDIVGPDGARVCGVAHVVSSITTPPVDCPWTSAGGVVMIGITMSTTETNGAREQLAVILAGGDRWKMMRDAKFALGSRCTRWDVYPQQEPVQAIAHDWHGFWALDEKAGWFRTPASYVIHQYVSESEAIAFEVERLLAAKAAQ